MKLPRLTGFAAGLALFTLLLAACGAGAAVDAVFDDIAGEVPAEEQPVDEAVENTPTGEAADEPATGAAAFQVTGESEARFLIGEVLNGSAITVVGVASSVSGTVTADYADTSTAAVQVSVDLSTLATDSSFRNRAIHSAILNTGNEDYRYATFESTAISGLPASVTVGETYEVQITGSLTIHGVTNEAVFEGIVTPVSETRLEGSASTAVVYADYNVRILRLPEQVASVEDTATLIIDLVAVAP
jgi:polyisoprenoid-binding protein YceI